MSCVSKEMARLGSEHPLCDSIQLIILILFFAIWGIDSISYFALGVSTIVVEFVTFPLLLLPAFSCWILGIFLVLKSHKEVFGEMKRQPKLNDSGVYSWVRHPMYLGTLMFCMGFLFIAPSLFSFGCGLLFSFSTIKWQHTKKMT